MSESKTLLQRFKDLPASGRTAIVGGTVLIVFLTVGTVMTNDPVVSGPKADVQKDNLKINTSVNNNSNEGVAVNLELANKAIADQKARIALLEEQNKQRVGETKDNTDGKWDQISNLVAQVQAQQERINTLEKGGAGTSGQTKSPPPPSPSQGLDARLPSGGSKEAAPPDEPKASSTPVIQIVGGEPRKGADVSQTKKEPGPYLPSGSNFEGVLLNGMDAGTGINANQKPTPALLRIKSEAILPNLFNFNVRECFVLVGGVGSLSSERVEMRTESMSCIAEDGTVWEGKIEGYVVGEDGKAGARGRLISKQGALLAKTFAAGLVGGFGSAFTAQPVNALNITSGGTQAYQYPDPSAVIGSGISGGLSKASASLASFYLKTVDQMFPILELDANRKMTIILLKGVSMTKDKSTK